LCLWGATAVAQSQNPLILTNDQEQHPLGPHLEILEDKEGAWTIEDVTSPAIANQFVTSQEAAPGFGFTDSAYWVRFHVQNEAKENAEWIVFYGSDAFFIDYYLPSNDRPGFEIVQTGTRLPFHTRDVPVGEFAFRLPVASQETKTVHMRFASEGALFLPLSIMTSAAFASENYTQQLSTGLLYGMLLILSLYNLVLYFYLRDSSYLYYVLYFSTILLGVMALYGFGEQYLWPNWPAFGAVAARSFLILSFTFCLLFSTSFLRTNIYTPRLHRIMRGTAAAIFIVLGLQFIWFRETAIVHVLLMIVSCCLMIIAGLLVWRKGYRPARYFLLGWTLVLLGFVIFILTLIDVLPFTDYIDTILRLGLIVLALVLSFGLADRINLLRQDKEAAQFAITAQRMQIARDLHDSVTQSLYSTNLFAEAGRETVQAGDTEGASHYFIRIGAVSQQALKEMRLFLYELRPPDVVDVGLVDALQKRLDAVEKRSGINIIALPRKRSIMS
jgi:signal transduction histidine kinase